MRKRRALIVCALVILVTMAEAQTQKRTETVLVQDCTGTATVLQSQGRVFVDVQELAKIAGGSVKFEKDRVVITLPRRDSTASSGDDAAASRFSPGFTSAAIEAMASVREWGGMLMTIVRNGYPVGNNMAGNTLSAYQARAADRVALASVAASTDADNRGLELLRGEFSTVQDWSERFVQARSSLSAANLSTSEKAIDNDADAQKALRCGEFLSQMFAKGSVQEDAACR
jgi:hypothetical protein